jgi:hypothetical protein
MFDHSRSSQRVPTSAGANRRVYTKPHRNCRADVRDVRRSVIDPRSPARLTAAR